MKISIIGSGRVGLSLGAVLANSGFSVLMTDKEDKKQEVLGKLSFYEPQLKEYLDKTQDKLEWTRWGEKLLSSDIIFFCLSFPIQKKGDLNLIELFDWIKYILDHSKGRKILVIKSTVPVGTHQKIQNIIADNKKITVVSCPEFLREGYAVHDLINPQKIVIGSSNQTAVTKLKEIYKKISKPKQIIQTTPETAELAKLAYNSFLGLKISFINEIAGFCEKVQADIDKLKLIIGSDSIREEDFLNQGLGYGGYCIPRDIETLILSAQKKHQNMDLLKIAQNINSSLVDHFFKKIKNQYKKLNGLSLTFWGISFKKGTDSLINSPALKLINKLLKSGAIIHVYDPCFVKEKVFKIFKNYKYPHIKNPIKKIFLKIFPIKDELVYLREKIFEGKCYFHAKALDSLDKGEALIIGSDCDEFKQIPLSKIKETVSFIFDSRSTYLIEDLNKNGLSFYKKGFEFFKADKHNENRLEDHRDDHHGLV